MKIFEKIFRKRNKMKEELEQLKNELEEEKKEKEKLIKHNQFLVGAVERQRIKKELIEAKEKELNSKFEKINLNLRQDDFDGASKAIKSLLDCFEIHCEEIKIMNK